MEECILTIDQSTSGTKLVVTNKYGEIIANRSKNHKQIYPKAGWVEHDPIEIYENVKQLMCEVSRGDKYHFTVLSITNQRETILVWDKNTGEPIYPAIVWQCRRTTGICEDFKKQGYEDLIQRKTGLTLDPYFSATKIKWIIDHVEGAREKLFANELLIGTIDSWLIWKLTNGQVHATDYTNASRTLLYNIYTLEWDQELLDIFGVPQKALPVVKSSNAIYGTVQDSSLPKAIIDLPISGIIGDSQGALFGQRCFKRGMAKATYGTGTSILVYTEECYKVKHGLVTSLAWGLNDKVDYAIEGIIHTSADSVKWATENLELVDAPSETEKLALSVSDNGGVYFIPAFVGLGAPYWSPNTRAAFIGIQRNTGKPHFVRAILESIAYQVKDIVDLLHEEYNLSTRELRTDGGAVKNKFLMQFQADMIHKQVTVSKTAELSALGSAYLAGLGIGLWKSLDEIKNLVRDEEVYNPEMSEQIRKQYYEGWKAAIQSVLK